MNILQINSSINGQDGQSTRIANDIVTALRAQNPGAQLKVRDVAQEPIPHLDLERFRNPIYSETLIRELKEADVVVLGVPMYNFGVPSQLKSWFDHVARAGVTFKYTDQGAVGLLGGKKAYVAAARGGAYIGTPADTQTPYVRAFLAFLGIEEVEFVYAEGLAMGAASRDHALASARAKVDGLFQQRIAA